MQIPGTATKTMYSPYFEHKITGKSLQELGCSEIVIVKIQTFELHSGKTVTQIVVASEGILSETEAYELKRISRLARKALKTFGKPTTAKEISDFTLFHNPCLYQISTFKKKGQPAPVLWLVGWTLARFSSEEIVQNGGSKVALGKVKKIIALLKKREITMQDVRYLGLELSNTELREINCLRSAFHLKFSVQPMKAFANAETEKVKTV